MDREEQDPANGDADSQENGDSDSDDSDHVKVTIGEIKSGPQTYGSLNVKVCAFCLLAFFTVYGKFLIFIGNTQGY